MCLAKVPLQECASEDVFALLEVEEEEPFFDKEDFELEIYNVNTFELNSYGIQNASQAYKIK
jgi:hypothetical protein